MRPVGRRDLDVLTPSGRLNADRVDLSETRAAIEVGRVPGDEPRLIDVIRRSRLGVLQQAVRHINQLGLRQQKTLFQPAVERRAEMLREDALRAVVREFFI